MMRLHLQGHTDGLRLELQQFVAAGILRIADVPEPDGGGFVIEGRPEIIEWLSDQFRAGGAISMAHDRGEA